MEQFIALLYAEGRFLGRFEHQDGRLTYVDENEGDVSSFRGKEQIYAGSDVVYELVYPGGILRDE